MRTAIKYYYNLDVDKIEYENNIYYFHNYILKPIYTNINYDIYNFFIMNNIPIYKIIMNKDNNYITYINNCNYILLLKDFDFDITIDIINNYSINIDNKNIKKWNELWSHKIDYYENNIIRVNNKYVLEIFPYYLCLSETALRLFNESKNDYTISICHKRIDNLSSFFSPDNYIIDYKSRDYSEYIKYLFFVKENDIEYIMNIIYRFDLKDGDLYLFFVRLLFPTYFFDCVENNNDIKIYSSKINLFEKLLKNIYEYISYKISMPVIDWLIKKNS